MTERTPGRNILTTRDSIDGRKKRLLALTDTIEQLRGLEEDRALVQSKDPSSDPTAEYRKRLERNIASQQPFLRDALSRKKLLSTALSAYYALIATQAFEKSAADDIAESTGYLKSSIENYTSEAGIAIQLMDEAFSVAQDNKGPRAELSQNAEKIRAALDETMPALELFFSDANVPRAEAVRERLKVIQKILRVGSPEKARWALGSAAAYVVQVIRNNDYAGHLSAETLLSSLAKKSLRDRLGSEPRPALMRADLESFLIGLQPLQLIEVLESVLTRLGLPEQVYLRKGHGYNILDQLDPIQELEAARAGSTAELYRRFGIHWFSRYGTSVLLDQYDQRDSSELPYGIFLAAADDHNDASFEESERNVVASTARQLKNLGYGLRIIECQGKRDISRFFKEFEVNYGNRQKPAFMFIRAHSSREHLEFGPEEGDGDVTTGDIADGLGVNDAFFAENPTFVLDGCAMGLRGGIAQKISEVFSATVLASKSTEGALTKISIAKENNKLVFHPRYEDDKGRENVTPHVYINGRRR